MEFYGIATRLNDGEFIVCGIDPYGPVGFKTIDEAKQVFKQCYNLSSLDRDSITFRADMTRLLLIRPAIYTFDLNNIWTVMNFWRQGYMMYQPDIPIVPMPHVVAPMRKGFLEKFMVLDIVQDIESMITIDVSGTIQVQEFKVRYWAEGEIPPPAERLTEEKAKEILRKKGLS